MVSKKHMDNIRTSARSRLHQRQRSTRLLTRMSSTIRLLSKLDRARVTSMRNTVEGGSVRSQKLPRNSKTRWKTSKMMKRRDCIARRLLIWEIFTIISIFKLDQDKSTPMILTRVSMLTSKLWPKSKKRMRKLLRKLKMMRKLER